MVYRYVFGKIQFVSATASETHITLSDTRGVRFQTVAPMGHVFVPEVPQLFPVTAHETFSFKQVACMGSERMD